MVAPERPIDVSPADEMLAKTNNIQSKLDNNLLAGPQIDSSKGWDEAIFDPTLHIASAQDSAKYNTYTFSDLGIPQPESASSPIAGTTPFPLFTYQSIGHIRRALFNPAYIHKTGCIFNQKTLILRNTAAYSAFFRHLWTHPEVIRRLSEAAGVLLEPVMETMELGHANVQVDFTKYDNPPREDKEASEESEIEKDKLLEDIAHDMTKANLSILPEGDDFRKQVPKKRSTEEIVKDLEVCLMPWHYDSYPWVCVAMVSMTDTMTGGETVIRRGDGGIEAIAQPGMGSAMMFQGGLVKHLALPSKSEAGDRITIVTSFRPASPKILDSSFMSNIRPYTDLYVLYHQWVSYRLARLTPALQRIHDARRFIILPDQKEYEELNIAMAEAKEYAKRTLRQMVDPEIVWRIASQYGIKIFFTIRDDYVANCHGPFQDCPNCEFHFGDPKWDASDNVIYCRFCEEMTGDKEVVVTKKHVNECFGARKWDKKYVKELWDDCEETQRVLKMRGGTEYQVRMKELQVRDVIMKWEMEGREWGIADEMAAQGLNEYLIEYLEWWGFVLH